MVVIIQQVQLSAAWNILFKYTNLVNLNYFIMGRKKKIKKSMERKNLRHIL